VKLLEQGHDPMVLVEMGQTHEGSVNLAKSFIDLSASAGADAVKVQIHLPEYESSPKEHFRDETFAEDPSRREFWERTSFSNDQWAALRDYARERNLLFIASAFSTQAIDLCVSLGVDALKIGSAESLQSWFLNYAALQNLPTIASTGLSGWADVDKTFRLLSPHLDYLALMQCTSIYPTPLAKTLPTEVPEMIRKFNVPIGYSDHSGRTAPPIMAIALGASLLEVHATFHPAIRGFDVASSLSFEQVGDIVRFRNDYVEMVRSHHSKDSVAAELSDIRSVFGRSASAVLDLLPNDSVTLDAVSFRKPAGGMSEEDIAPFLGGKLARAVKKGEFFKPEDFAE
jgi:N,N'-diacetyllegionaminate synthase